MLNHRGIDNNLRSFKKTLAKTKQFSAMFASHSDAKLSEMSQSLKDRALQGAKIEDLAPEAYAIVFEAVKRTLGLTPFDVQLLAAAAMSNGRIIEMPTGEGKTLVAVFVAYLAALTGKGVHVLTFNDYLARRDALWMKPAYDFLGVSVRYIQEGMTPKERKDAYNADITYAAAKEVGFDYLNGFLAFDPEDVMQRGFHLAIIDEVDSILIDEARVPLVIAGDIPAMIVIEKKIFAVVSGMRKDVHFQTDEYANNIFLTDRGITYVEKSLGLENLYDAKNVAITAKVNVILQALFLLTRDVDYIIKDEKLLLVDEFTGRVMRNRQWPDGVHAAVEIKEGLTPKNHGVVMNSITMQNFLKLYPDICGMTGTACASAPEFFEFYNSAVTVIPPNRPCIRIDHPDVIYTHKDAKYRALIDEIRKVHATGRPILAGTASIEESEYLAGLLKDIPEISVLNAKNDEEEAEIIANAGSFGAVTISTNMAGRGVDIHLGGRHEEEHERVRALGGLYVIGTTRYESDRIDNQLRGRAGRQGDPGESRFFISLEDSLLVKYRIREALPDSVRDVKQDGPLENPLIHKAIAHTQRVMEGQTFDAKMTIQKYAMMVEDQRRIVHSKREKILRGEDTLAVFEKTFPDRCRELLTKIKEIEFLRAQKEIELFAINTCWADYLLFIEGVLDGVQIISIVKGDPFLTYNQKLVDAFDELEKHINDTVLGIYDTLVIQDGRINLNQMGIKGPSSTRTYMVQDGTELQSLINEFGAAMFNPVLYSVYLIYANFKKKKKQKDAE